MGIAPTGIASLFLATALAVGVEPGARVPAPGDLDAVRQRGVLRHLGIPYARFVSGPGAGLDADLVRAFAASLGVRYEFVETSWGAALGDLIGRRVSAGRPDPRNAPATEVRGDVLAAGITVLPWRTRSVAFSAPTFPTQVWIVAVAESPVVPVAATGDVDRDVQAVRRALGGKRVLGVPGTCIDPALHDVAGAGGRPVLLQTERLDEVAPALLRGEGDLALLDVADADLAFERWPGRFKVIGPVTPVQDMAVAFRKDSPALRRAFDAFLAGIRADGTYDRLVVQHFPRAAALYPDRFPGRPGASAGRRPKGAGRRSTRAGPCAAPARSWWRACSSRRSSAGSSSRTTGPRPSAAPTSWRSTRPPSSWRPWSPRTRSTRRKDRSVLPPSRRR